MTLTDTASEPRTRYLVLAALCDCDGVAITVLDGCYSAQQDPPGPDEVLLFGNDWRPLAVQAASELATRTGLPVRPACTVAASSEASVPLKDVVTDAMYDEFGTEVTKHRDHIRP